MGAFINKIKDKYDPKLDKLLVSKTFYILATLCFFILVSIIFAWGRSWHLRCQADQNVLGTFGDFIGGVLGTIFGLITIFFLIKTFNQQRLVTEENRKLIELQRFNDLFFELLKSYNGQIQNLIVQNEVSLGGVSVKTVKSDGKDFFDEMKEKLVKEFVPSNNYNRNRKAAVSCYISNCVDKQSQLSVCYRTIYRILDLIDNSKIEEQAKVDYLKITRSQFTENELLFLRYHIKYGKYIKFAIYVDKYNVMKHLPLLELLEFRYWTANVYIDQIGVNAINILFKDIFKSLRRGNFFSEISRCRGAFKIKMNFVKKDVLELIVNKKALPPSCTDNLRCIYDFSDDDLCGLFQCALKEFVVFSNFSIYNNYSDLVFDSRIIATSNLDSFHFKVANRLHKPINVRYNESIVQQGIKYIN